MDTFEDFLEHYGIPGMRWGIRRGRNAGGSSGSHKPRLVSEDAHAFKELTTKAKIHGSHSLTNAELKKLNERFDMEKKYSKLESEMKAKKNSMAHRLAKKLLEQMADRALSAVAGHVVDAHVEKFKAGKTVAKMLPKTKP